MLSNPQEVADDIGKKFDIGPTPVWAMQEELWRRGVFQPYDMLRYPTNSLREIFAHFKLEPTVEVSVIVEYDDHRIIGHRAGFDAVESFLKRVFRGQDTSVLVYDSSEKWLLSINESGGAALLTRAEG
jgi:hypothetical protein